LFQAGLALDAMQQATQSAYEKGRAGAAAAALNSAVRDLRTLSITLGAADG
jgi:hypothetical protein